MDWRFRADRVLGISFFYLSRDKLSVVGGAFRVVNCININGPAGRLYELKRNQPFDAFSFAGRLLTAHKGEVGRCRGNFLFFYFILL